MAINSNNTNDFQDFSLAELAAHAVMEASKRLDEQKIPLSDEAKRRLHGVWIDIKIALSDTSISQIMHALEKSIIVQLISQQKENITDIATKIESLWEQFMKRIGNDSLPISIDSCRNVHKQWENKALKHLWSAISKQIDLPSNLTAIGDIEAWFEDPANSKILQSITEITITDCSMRVLPPQLLQCSQLQKLTFINTEITTLPEWFGNFSQLQELCLIHNEIIALPESFGNLSQLKALSLSDTQITTLPKSFGNLSQLSKFYFTSNKVTTLPEWFGNLSQLQDVCLNRNQITTLPVSFGKLSQLKSLNLSGNQITALPESFANLNQLQCLYLENTQIATIPESLRTFSQLQIFGLKSNV